MKQDKVQLQNSVFGDFSVIQTNADTISYFMTEFSDREMIPSVIERPTEMQGQFLLMLGPNLRFTFRTESGRWTINFASERVDVLHVKTSPDDADLEDVDEFINECSKVFISISKRFPMNYSRLSLVSKYAILNTSEDEMHGFFSNRLGNSQFYSDNTPEEWSYRITARKEFAFKAGERVNVITQMGAGKIALKKDEKVEMINGIDLMFDINTVQENLEPRFTNEDLLNFLSEAAKVEVETFSGATLID